ncbi:MAG: ABC transporter ATP-binding protein [Candidatus Shapirobacteria bacterium]|jgi:ABC-type polysaccharide/polyol phosphate transport system ATPase subunit
MEINNIAIKFDEVTKDFSRNNQKTFKEFLPALIYGEKTVDKFTVFSNVSFEIKKGECVGVIGPNGSGKSTILKLIAGVMSPSKGKIHVHGKVSPLIELGAGMHPELTGRENVYLNGAILGLSRRQIDDNFQSILDFSELTEFIDQPIKHYSSGMYMRLAFSIAIHVNPEILIVDEILAVGDTAFQAKCFSKMEEFKNSGVTIIFVSHSLPQVRAFCTSAIYINHHALQQIGDTATVCQTYENDQKQ